MMHLSSDQSHSECSDSKWVLITEENIFKSGENKTDSNVHMCKLRHPKTGQQALYLFSSDGGVVYEIMSHSPKFGSWLIGETVQQDGGLLLSTPVDPLFLILPYLINAGGRADKFMLLDQIVQDDDFPDCRNLLHCQGMDLIEQIADTRGVNDGMRAFRYSQEKTLSWLKVKTQLVARVLSDRGVVVKEGGSHSTGYVRSKKEVVNVEAAYLKYSFGIVSEYLPSELGAILAVHLGIKDLVEGINSGHTEIEPANKRPKVSTANVVPTEDYSQGSKELKNQVSKGKLTPAQKRLSNVDKSGMKNISSFFATKR